MEITPANQGTVEHSSSRQSESSEIDKMIGSAHLIQKSSSFEEEESSRMVEQNLDNFSELSLDQTETQNGNPEPTTNVDQNPTETVNEQPTLPEINLTEQPKDYTDSRAEENNIPIDNKVQGVVSNEVHDPQQCYQQCRQKLSLSDKQTSTTSLEEQNKEEERESAAECLLRVLSREATSRPASLPSDLASLWHSLKIASELNKSLKDTKEESDTEGTGSTSDLHNGIAKPIDLQKLFTPAEDAPEILPRNKKMFASSSFYGPNHPTVEEQVELARRISSSLSDISNKESKGQSMYVNRKKRSVKWIHTGEEGQQQQQNFSEFSEINQTENLPPTPKINEKPILKLVMNPRGHVQDLSSLKGQVDATPSPEVCFDLVKDLNSPCGKGAELFAKRRKKAEKWVVDESNVKTSNEMTSMSSYESYNTQTHTQLGKLATPTLPTNMANLPTPSYLKDIPPRFGPQAAKNQIPDKYTQPKVRLIKSPWEAALEGSVENAFQDRHTAPSPTPRGNIMIAPSPSSFSKMMTPPPPQSFVSSNDIYAKPPKAWHPQPTGKQLSSVNLEQIFEGSPRSPVSLAYHPDTNTLSSEPVPVENIPPIAVKLYDYEIIDPSILRDQPPRRPDEVLADVQLRNKVHKSQCGGKWPPTSQEHDIVGWNPNIANWAKTSQTPQQSHPPQSMMMETNHPPQAIIQEQNQPTQPMMLQQNYDAQPMMQQQNYPAQPMMQQQNYPAQPMMQQQNYAAQPLMEQQSCPVQPVVMQHNHQPQPSIMQQVPSYQHSLMQETQPVVMTQRNAPPQHLNLQRPVSQKQTLVSPTAPKQRVTWPPPLFMGNEDFEQPPQTSQQPPLVQQPCHPQPQAPMFPQAASVLGDNIKSQPEYKLPSPQPMVQPKNLEQPLSMPSMAPQSQQSSTPNNLYVDLKVVSNFNTAPRGWQSNMSYYRPVTFSTETNQYTDF